MLTALPTAVSTGPIDSTVLTIDGSHLVLVLGVVAAAVVAGMLAHTVKAWLSGRDVTASTVRSTSTTPFYCTETHSFS